MSNNNQNRDLNFFAQLWRDAKLTWRLMRDPEVPIYLKLIPAAAAIYLISPVDFIPEALLAPVLGPLTGVDDLGILYLGVKSFLQFTPNDIIQRHMDDLNGGVVEGEWQDGNDGGLHEEIILDPQKYKNS